MRLRSNELHGSTYTPFRSKIRLLRFERTSSKKEQPRVTGSSTIRLHAATRGLCNLSTTLNVEFCTSPFWNLNVDVLNPSSRIFSAFAAMYSWGVLFNSSIPTADATPTGRAQAAQPESIFRSILSPISASTALVQRFPLLWAFHRRCACLRIFSQACQCRRLYLSCRLTAPMKRPGTSSLAFSPDGWSFWPSGHSSRDAPFLPVPPLPLRFGFGSGPRGDLGACGFSGAFFWQSTTTWPYAHQKQFPSNFSGLLPLSFPLPPLLAPLVLASLRFSSDPPQCPVLHYHLLLAFHNNHLFFQDRVVLLYVLGHAFQPRDILLVDEGRRLLNTLRFLNPPLSSCSGRPRLPLFNWASTFFVSAHQVNMRVSLQNGSKMKRTCKRRRKKWCKIWKKGWSEKLNETTWSARFHRVSWSYHCLSLWSNLSTYSPQLALTNETPEGTLLATVQLNKQKRFHSWDHRQAILGLSISFPSSTSHAHLASKWCWTTTLLLE